MANSITFRGEIPDIQLLMDKLWELKKNYPDLFKNCSIIIDVVSTETITTKDTTII